MKFFYDYGNKSVRLVDDDACVICGSDECNCAEVAEDALEKMVSTLGRDFGVPNHRVRELLKQII